VPETYMETTMRL